MDIQIKLVGARGCRGRFGSVFPALTDCSYLIAGNYSGGSEPFVDRIKQQFVEKIIPEGVVDKQVAQ
jgi:hypothetical protein